MPENFSRHPDETRNEAQKQFLDKCEPKDRRFHELLFMVGNATYRYHQQAKEYEPSESDWQEWIEGLPEGLQRSIKDDGFENGKRSWPFTRYVMEKHDNGLEEYLTTHLGSDIMDEFNKLTK